MPRQLINIRGYNGSGKSTIIFELIKKYNAKDIYYNGKIIATMLLRKNIIILGSYHNNTGGCDVFKNTSVIYNVLQYILAKYPNHDVIMEGIIISTIKTKIKDLFLKLQKKYNLVIKIVILTTSLPLCVENILNNRKGNITPNISKYNLIQRHYTYFKDYFPVFKLNNTKSKESLLINFLRIMEG